MGRTLVVGDIHGCLEELEDLLSEAGFDRGDSLVSVGDLVGKGPEGAAVVRRFREGGHRAVRGNHDEKLLAWRRGERDSLSESHAEHAAELDAEDWAWLEGLPLWLEVEGALVVHAGLMPGVALADQDPRLLMNLRSIDDDGAGSSRIDAGAPWASRWEGPQLVVFGHDAVSGLQLWPHAIGLDTGCVYGGELTGIWLPQRRLVSVPSSIESAFAEASP